MTEPTVPRVFIGVQNHRIALGSPSCLFSSLDPSHCIAYDGHNHLHLLDSHKMTRLRSLNVTQFDFQLQSVTYCQEPQSILALSTQGELHAFRANLEYICKTELKLRHALDIIYTKGKLVVRYPSNITLIEVQIASNLRTARFSSSLYYTVTEVRRVNVPCPSFAKELRVIRESLLAIWSVTDIKIFDVIDETEILRIGNLASVNNQLSAICFTVRKGYLVAGLHQGQICVYAFDNSKHLINELEGHSKKVLDLRLIKADSQVVSSSQDDTIRIFSLESMQQLEMFRVGHKFNMFRFVTQDRFMASEGINIFIGCLSPKLDHLHTHKSSVQYSSGPTTRTLLSLSDNTLLYFGQKPIPGYSPPLCRQVLQLEFNPYSNQYWLFTSDKQIYIYKIDQAHQPVFSVTGIHKIREFENMVGNINSFEVGVFKFVALNPVRFDAEIKQNTLEANQQSVREFKGIAFGCERGDVLILSTNRMNFLQCHLKFHKQPISCISCPSKNVLLSICKSNTLILSKVPPDSPPTILLSITLGPQFDTIFKLPDYLLLAYHTGQFELCQYDSGELMRSPAGQVLHQGRILSASFNKELGLIATASMDGTVKLWALGGECVLDIVVDAKIEWVQLREKDIFMSVNGRLSRLDGAYFRRYLETHKVKPVQRQPVRSVQKPHHYSSLSLPEVPTPRNKSVENIIKTRKMLAQRKSSRIHLPNLQSPRAAKIQGYGSLFHLPKESLLSLLK